jgi:DNA-binding LytR/AlgR family response regulator
VIKENALLRILVVDDEPLIALTIKKILIKLGYIKIELAHSESKAVELISTHQFSLAIFDINLNGAEEGINLAKVCLDRNIPFFYISSYTDKSTLDRALETAPGAYVTKPFMQGNIYSAIELTIGKQAQREDPFVTIKDGGNYYRIRHSEILYLKSDNVYIEIYTKEKSYLYRDSIKNFLALLNNTAFIKVHRTYAVNIQHIRKLNTNTVFIDKIEIPLSRTFKKELLDRI